MAEQDMDDIVLEDLNFDMDDEDALDDQDNSSGRGMQAILKEEAKGRKAVKKKHISVYLPVKTIAQLKRSVYTRKAEGENTTISEVLNDALLQYFRKLELKEKREAKKNQ